jgi:hypothetical protein
MSAHTGIHQRIDDTQYLKHIVWDTQEGAISRIELEEDGLFACIWRNYPSIGSGTTHDGDV